MAPKKPPPKKAPPKNPATVRMTRAAKAKVGKSTTKKAAGLYETMTVQQLKKTLEGRGLPQGGRKVDLISRLRGHGKQTTAGKTTAGKTTAGKTKPGKSITGKSTMKNGIFESMTVKELKASLGLRGLPQGGRKIDLISRLRDHGKQNKAPKITARTTTAVKPAAGKSTAKKATGILDTWTVQQLKKALEGRGLPQGGKKADLISRLRDYGKQGGSIPGAPNPGPSTTETHKKTYKAMKKDELVAEAASRGLPTGGNKADIIRRLENSDRKKPAPPPPKVPEPKVPHEKASTSGSSTSDSSSEESSTGELPVTTPYQPKQPTTQQPGPSKQPTNKSKDEEGSSPKKRKRSPDDVVGANSSVPKTQRRGYT